MKAFSYDTVVRVLIENGFSWVRGKGSHEIYKNAEGKTVIVAFHGKAKMIPLGTCAAIVKQSGLSKKLFE